MVRMSDIFKREEDSLKEAQKQTPKQDLAKEKPTEKQPEEKKEKIDIKETIKKIEQEEEKSSESAKKESLDQTRQRPKEEPISLSSPEPSRIIKESFKIEDKQQTEQLYNQTIQLVKEILLRGQNNESIEGKKIQEIVEKLVDQLALGNSELMGLLRNSTPENYLYGHSVNVCILSIVLGLGLNYDRKRLVELGIAAILHDIGMIRVADIAEKPEKLSEEEYNKIKKHPFFGVEILELSKDISRSAIYVAREHHECIDGSGYPQGLKGEQINEYAKIVATVDMYEALTHPRPHRDAILPFDAMKNIVKDKDSFGYRYLKVLIEQISVYPIGSWVELSSGEIGEVIKINKSAPLRPIINVILDTDGQKLSPPKSIDLTKTPNLFIKKPIRQNELKL